MAEESEKDPIEDLMHIGLGLGILGFQQAQVRRRQFEKDHPTEVELVRSQLRAVGAVAGALAGVAASVVRPKN